MLAHIAVVLHLCAILNADRLDSISATCRASMYVLLVLCTHVTYMLHATWHANVINLLCSLKAIAWMQNMARIVEQTNESRERVVEAKKDQKQQAAQRKDRLKAEFLNRQLEQLKAARKKPA